MGKEKIELLKGVLKCEFSAAAFGSLVRAVLKGVAAGKGNRKAGKDNQVVGIWSMR